jgi:hypothetical protein
LRNTFAGGAAAGSSGSGGSHHPSPRDLMKHAIHTVANVNKVSPRHNTFAAATTTAAGTASQEILNRVSSSSSSNDLRPTSSSSSGRNPNPNPNSDPKRLSLRLSLSADMNDDNKDDEGNKQDKTSQPPGSGSDGNNSYIKELINTYIDKEEKTIRVIILFFIVSYFDVIVLS